MNGIRLRVHESTGGKSGVAGGLMIVAGLLGLLGLSAATAWAEDTPDQGVDARPTASEIAVQPVTTRWSSSTDSVQEMIQDHMGVTGEDADAWASEMVEHMREIHGDDVEAVLDHCREYWNGDSDGKSNSPGPGSMMEGNQSDDYGPGGMMGGSDFGGMMGRQSPIGTS